MGAGLSLCPMLYQAYFSSGFGSFLGHREGWFEFVANVIVFKGYFFSCIGVLVSCKVMYLALR